MEKSELIKHKQYELRQVRTSVLMFLIYNRNILISQMVAGCSTWYFEKIWHTAFRINSHLMDSNPTIHLGKELSFREIHIAYTGKSHSASPSSIEQPQSHHKVNTKVKDILFVQTFFLLNIADSNMKLEKLSWNVFFYKISNN